MSVASRNPFDILSDETEPTQVPSSEKVANKDSQASNAPAARGNQRGRGPASRGGRYYQRGGAAGAGAGAKPSSPRDQAAEGDDAAARDGKRNNDDGNRGRGRGRGRGDRGVRGGRGRPFDRHSQTGKTDSDKKIHQGWGGDEGNSELKAEVDGSKDAAAEGTPTNDWAIDGNAAAATDGWGIPIDPAGTTDAAILDMSNTQNDTRRPREEEEDNTLTLDQYLAQQKERSAVPKLESIRKPNEGADDAIWKDAVPLSKNNEDEYFSGKAKSAPKPRAKANEKVYLEIDAHFDRPQRGGRGGRGEARGSTRGTRARGGRGGRGRGEFHSTNGSAPQVDVDNQAEFPSLS